MSTRDLSIVVIRAVALLSFLVAVMQLHWLGYVAYHLATGTPSGGDLIGALVTGGFPMVGGIVVAVALWVIAPWLADQISAPTDDEHAHAPRITAGDVTALMLVTLGLIFVILGLAEFLSSAVQTVIYYLNRDPDTFALSRQMIFSSHIGHLVAGLVQLLLGLGLVVGRRRIVSWIQPLRTLGVNHTRDAEGSR